MDEYVAVVAAWPPVLVGDEGGPKTCSLEAPSLCTYAGISSLTYASLDRLNGCVRLTGERRWVRDEYVSLACEAYDERSGDDADASS